MSRDTFLTHIRSDFDEADRLEFSKCCRYDLFEARVQEWNMLLSVESLEGNVKLLNQLLLLQYGIPSAELLNRKKNDVVCVDQRQH